MPFPTTQEEVMSVSIPKQHPAVVLRSHYVHLRALLAIAMIALVAMSATVVLLATDDDSSSAPAAAAVSAPGPTGTTTRFDGGPEEGTRAVAVTSGVVGTRYDGGPDEGTRDVSLPK